MKRLFHTLAIAMAVASLPAQAQTLPAKWEDLTAADFVKALAKSGGTCMLPIGSVDKFGPAGPLGTNLYLVRLVALEAAKQEYAIVFPDYFASVTGSSAALPGTIAYSPHLRVELLQETIGEMARNGCRKILLVNGHTTNMPFLSTFLEDFHQQPHDYALYYIYGPEFPVFASQYAKLPKDIQPSAPGVDGHGGEERIAALLAWYPDLIHLDRAHDEPSSGGHGAANERDIAPRHTASGFVDSVSNGYSGDPSGATVTRGKALVKYVVDRLVLALKDIKADDKTVEVEKTYIRMRDNPSAGK
jgi:creatinine amidohydrolase